MDPLIASFIIAWVVMRLGRAVREEYQHSRDAHGTRLSRENPGWSPGRVRRNARRRARGDWLTEIADGFPTLRRTLEEDRLLARTVRAEAEAAGEVRIRDLRERLAKAAQRRDESRKKAAGETAEPGPEPSPARVPEPAAPAAPEPGPSPAAEPAPGTRDSDPQVPGPRVPPEEDSRPAVSGNDEDDAIPNPPSDEKTDETAEPEGDDVTAIEDAETPYLGMQNAFLEYAAKAAAIAKEAGDDLAAQAAIHGFDRDGATMADIQALEDQAGGLIAAANAARAGLISRHADGEEYHGTGQDAHASAFRAA